MRDRWSTGRARHTAEYSLAQTSGVALAVSLTTVVGALVVMYVEAVLLVVVLSAAVAAVTLALLTALQAYGFVGRSLRLEIPLTSRYLEVTLDG
mgnify:CR=1 FL=1